jgi:uncharacterized protein (UPF0332 family)
MNVSDFLDHAEELANDGRPAWCRSAVSRAYYAAHHAAVDFLFQVGVRTPGGPKRHVAAFNALVAIDVATDQPVKQAGVDLTTLHGKRNRADYDWNDLSAERQDQAQVLVERAREIVTALDDCLADDDRVDDLYAYFRAWVPLHGHHLGLTLV